MLEDLGFHREIKGKGLVLSKERHSPSTYGVEKQHKVAGQCRYKDRLV